MVELKLFDQLFKQDIDASRVSTTKKESFNFSSTTDSRSITSDYTFAPTIITNSPNARASPTIKKELSSAAEAPTGFSAQGGALSNPLTKTTAEGGSSGLDTNFLILAAAGVGVAIALSK